MTAAQLLRPANDNLPISAEFRHLPEAFISIYAKEIYGWAARLQERGPFLRIMLWNRPGATVISSDYWPEVTLRCDLLMHEISKKMVMAVQPDTEKDVEIVAKHTEALPSIMAAQRAAAAENWDKPKGMARWTFDGSIPDYFVHRYASELRAWAANFKKIGLIKTIVLREGGLSDLSPNEEQGAVLIGVKLLAKIDRLQGDDLQICASAASEQDEMLIRKHCEKMQRNKVPAGMVLVEPPRPGIPFLPDHIKPN